MANHDYGELFCLAVDEIVKKRLEGVSYDSTILCTIVDDSSKEKGVYVVTNNGTTKFNAVSDNTSYRNNDNVYVQIPGGDWLQQKTIISKKTDNLNESYVYKKPFSSLVDITGNLISSNINSNETGLIANAFDPDIKDDPEKDKYDDQYQAVTLWTYNANDVKALRNEQGSPHSAYTRLGIQAKFQSWLNPFYVIPLDSSDEEEERASVARYIVEGDYGLRLRIRTIDEIVSKEEEGKEACYDLYLNCADMNGNPYDFQSFYVQEKVFDISEVGKIVAMELQFYQTAGTFKDRFGEEILYTDFLNHKIKPNLYVSDPYISLGYDIDEFNEEMVQIYTLDTTVYSRTENPLTNNHKKVQLRWIHKQDDGTFKSISIEDSDMDYEIRWYRYELGHSSADEYSGVYWKNLSKQTKTENGFEYEILDNDWKIYNQTCTAGYKRDPEFFTTWMIPDTTLQQEQIKAIIIYKNQPYRSNILVCRNKNEVVSKPTVDAVQALSIVCVDKEGQNDDGSTLTESTYGNYRIYGQNGSLLDYAQSNMKRKWIPYFQSSTGGADVAPSELLEAESIEWIIPTNKTMIVIDDFPYLGQESDDSNKIIPTIDETTGKVSQRYWYDLNDDKRLHIIRYGEGTKGNDISRYNFQSYRIKSYYSQTYSDNTIQCKIVKDKITYTATKELTFGIAGTSGTDCTFILDFDNGVTAMTVGSDSLVNITARLYDYENKEVDLTGRSITWSWKTSDEKITFPDQDENNISNNTSPTQELKLTGSIGASYNILQAKVNWGDHDLLAYLPIPIRAANTYAYISGTTHVIYNSAGELLDYFKNPYILYGNNTNEIAATWTCLNGYIAPEGVKTDESAYTPKITKDTKTQEQYLTPLSFYVSGACEKVCVIGEVGGNIVWSQPLLIMQNKYPSAMVNEWDGNLNVGGIDKGTIFAPRFVAGKKETDNKFSGVMLGNWSNTVSDNSLTQGDTGLYGYDKGEQSYAFKQDGTAFIGKSGTGRIEFDGTKGVIESGTYEAGKGMSINLAAGTIDAHQFKLTAGTLTDDDSAVAAGKDKTILIDTTANTTTGFPLQIGSDFKVDWYGKLIAQSGSFTGDITSGSTITGATIKGGEIIVPSSATGKTDAVFYVGESGDMKAYNADIEGVITATTLTCGNGTIGGWTIGTTYLQGGSTILNKDGSIAAGGLSIDKDGNASLTGKITAKSGSIGGWTVVTDQADSDVAGTFNALYSKHGTYYTCFDASRDNVIAVGIPEADFIGGSGQTTFNNAKFRVISDGTCYASALNITGGSFKISKKDANGTATNVFEISDAGVLTATSGKIGSWSITSGALTNGTTSLGSDGKITCANVDLSGSSSTINGVSISNGTISNASISNGSITNATITQGSIGNLTISGDCNVSALSIDSMKFDGAAISVSTVSVVTGVKSVTRYGYWPSTYGSIILLTGIPSILGSAEDGYYLDTDDFLWTEGVLNKVGITLSRKTIKLLSATTDSSDSSGETS